MLLLKGFGWRREKFVTRWLDSSIWNGVSILHSNLLGLNEIAGKFWPQDVAVLNSKKSEINRCNSKFKPHKGGSNSIATIRQKLSKKLGRKVNDIEAWVHTHRSSNPEDITSLNTEEATTCLSVALHTGMPVTAVPNPMPPPPDPPIYAVLPTPNPSHDNADIFGSSVRAETPVETISRIACGVFRGHPSGTSAGVNETTSGVNGTASGGGTYSPPLQEEQFPFF